jgi:hypothetical protein
MKINKIILFVGVGLIILIAACTGTPTDDVEAIDPTQVNTPIITESGYPPLPVEATVVSGYPAPPVVPTVDSGYPEPNSGQSEEFYATPGPIPQPSSATGVIVGAIQVSNKPIPNLAIYLAEVLVDGEGQERVASYDRANSPRAFTDEQGQFVFSNIEPGKYGLVLDTVLSSYLLHLPQEEIALVIMVDAGQQTDVELLNYDTLPISQSDN